MSATILETLHRATAEHQAGHLAEAERLYRQVLDRDPHHADALHRLGVIAHQTNQPQMARELIVQAIGLRPSAPDFHLNLGQVYAKLGQFEAAIAEYQRALELRPRYATACYNLALAFTEQGLAAQAVAAYRQALEFQPDFAEAHNNLGVLLANQGCLQEAVQAHRRAIALKPAYAQAHNNLGNALQSSGELAEAIVAYRRAIELAPDLAEEHNNLGTALAACGDLVAAVVAYRRALELNPRYVEAHNNLGNALRDSDQLDEAIASYTRALELKPDHASAHNNLGNALMDQGHLDQAIAAYRQALEFQPQCASLHSNIIYCLHLHSRCDQGRIREEQNRWNLSFTESFRGKIEMHSNEPDPKRRLRVGYVSPDLRNHVVGRNLLPLFVYHNHEEFEIFCYADTVRADSLNQRLRERTHHWRSTVGKPNVEVADLIRQDRVDLLVDLSQHTASNRLPLFAHQPAPVQVSFAGYPASTGIPAIGSRISDRWLELSDSAVSVCRPSILVHPLESHSPFPTAAPQCTLDRSVLSPEQLYLLDSFWCYDPNGADLAVNPLPAVSSGLLSFGCLSNFCKINDKMLALWAGILKEVSNSRLFLLARNGSHRRRTLEFFQSLQIAPARLRFLDHCSREDYLKCYHDLDLILDSFPYNGHTTNLDALWMGVPVVTLAGTVPVSRAGLSQLSNLGLPGFIAASEEEYVRIATDAASDLPRLQELRSTLRQRMESSVLMDGPGFARQIERAYRQMWRAWCAKKCSSLVP